MNTYSLLKTGQKTGKGKNWYLGVRKETLGQFQVANRERTMCSQYFRKLHYNFGFHSLVPFFVFLD